MALFGFSGVGELPARLTTLMFVALAPGAIVYGLVRDFRSDGAITIRTMFGVLCVYLLIGMLFGSIYGAISAIDPGGFFESDEPGTVSNLVYFSYATLTTVGYGDLVAGSDLGRSLAIVEALIGQITWSPWSR